jgi:hypothetical protein
MTLADWLYATFIRWPRSAMWTCAVVAAIAIAKLLGAP